MMKEYRTGMMVGGSTGLISDGWDGTVGWGEAKHVLLPVGISREGTGVERAWPGRFFFFFF